ncbi:hypothetical protein [Streptomyces sp. NPDC091215]|uniref:hypothetical protein n=1 Tax=Streptomyces sp. NPDC091215 TaxID=3155192 RepID=UPI003439CEE4
MPDVGANRSGNRHRPRDDPAELWPLLPLTLFALFVVAPLALSLLLPLLLSFRRWCPMHWRALPWLPVKGEPDQNGVPADAHDTTEAGWGPGRRLGVVGEAEHRAVQRAREEVVAMIVQGTGPFADDAGHRDWRPEPGRPAPALPADALTAGLL